jgi:hypothetical protein
MSSSNSADEPDGIADDHVCVNVPAKRQQTDRKQDLFINPPHG